MDPNATVVGVGLPWGAGTRHRCPMLTLGNANLLRFRGIGHLLIYTFQYNMFIKYELCTTGPVGRAVHDTALCGAAQAGQVCLDFSIMVCASVHV